MGGGDLNLTQFKKQDFNTLNDDEKSEGFIFHILTDKTNSQNKLKALEQELNQIYPCEIRVHICDDTKFQASPKWNGNYLAYYRLFIPELMPSNLKTCLYLDVDMLVFKDLRELFTLNLENKVAGVIEIRCLYGIYSKNTQNKNFMFDDFYFNSGLLLINLNEWKNQKITEKCFDFFANYEIISPDNNALCGVIQRKQALILPYEYNILINHYDPNHILWNRRKYIQNIIPYTEKQIEFAYSNPIIWHYLAGNGKPWDCNEEIGSTDENQTLNFYWWQMAFQTPIFKDELKEIFTAKAENYLICKDFGFYIASLMIECQKSFLGFFKMPFVVFKAFKDFDLSKTYSTNKANLDKNLAFELFFTATKAYCRKKLNAKLEQFLSLPYKAYRAKKRCQKGNFRAKRQSLCYKIFAE